MLQNPYAFIKEHGECIGVADLPKDLFSKEFCFPSVNEENIWKKSAAVESILQQHGIDISINIYVMANDKVHNAILNIKKTVSASRLASSVSILYKSETSRPRNHKTSFNLLLDKKGDNLFHCSNVLNIGKFIYHNEERFIYNNGPEELVNILKTSDDSLTDTHIGGERKVPTGDSTRSKFRSLQWQNVYTCNACLTGFLRICKFCDHIKQYVGGHVSGMSFDPIPQVEHFEEKEFPSTLLCPIVASFDVETCGNTDITRRVNKEGKIYKTDELKKSRRH